MIKLIDLFKKKEKMNASNSINYSELLSVGEDNNPYICIGIEFSISHEDLVKDYLMFSSIIRTSIKYNDDKVYIIIYMDLDDIKDLFKILNPENKFFNILIKYSYYIKADYLHELYEANVLDINTYNKTISTIKSTISIKELKSILDKLPTVYKFNIIDICYVFKGYGGVSLSRSILSGYTIDSDMDKLYDRLNTPIYNNLYSSANELEYTEIIDESSVDISIDDNGNLKFDSNYFE